MLKNLIFHKAFKVAPLKSLINCISLVFLIIFKKKIYFPFYIKNKKIYGKFDYLSKGYGGRGIFIFRENYEKLLKFSYKFIKNGDEVLDCGANQGVFSLVFAVLNKKGRTLIVEPIKKYNEIIIHNLKLNRCRNYKIINDVIADKNKYYYLDISHQNVSASIIKKFGKKKLKVKGSTIDSISKRENLKKLSFIKLDLEGAEYLALKGAKKTIEKFKPVISIETNKKNFKNIKIPKNFKKFEIDDYGKLKEVKNIVKFYDNLILIHKDKLYKFKYDIKATKPQTLNPC